MEKKVLGTFNIASGEGIQIKDFVKSMTKREIKIKSLGEPDYLVANIDKLNRFLNEK